MIYWMNFKSNQNQSEIIMKSINRLWIQIIVLWLPSIDKYVGNEIKTIVSILWFEFDL